MNRRGFFTLAAGTIFVPKFERWFKKLTLPRVYTKTFIYIGTKWQGDDFYTSQFQVTEEMLNDHWPNYQLYKKEFLEDFTNKLKYTKNLNGIYLNNGIQTIE
jgi:hypothetical protein